MLGDFHDTADGGCSMRDLPTFGLIKPLPLLQRVFQVRTGRTVNWGHADTLPLHPAVVPVVVARNLSRSKKENFGGNAT